MNLYETLGVKKDATQEQISKAYRKIVLKCHPDHHPDKADEFKSVSHAFEVLSDPERRKNYDQTGNDVQDDNYMSALTLISMVLDKVLSSIPPDENVVRHVSESVRQIKHQLSQTLRELLDGKDALDKIIKFVTCKGSENVLVAIAKSKLIKQELAIQEVKSKLSEVSLALEIVNRHDWKGTAPTFYVYKGSITNGF